MTQLQEDRLSNYYQALLYIRDVGFDSGDIEDAFISLILAGISVETALASLQ